MSSEAVKIQAKHLKSGARVIIPRSKYVLTVDRVSFFKCTPPKVSVIFRELSTPIQIPESELVEVVAGIDLMPSLDEPRYALNKEQIKSLMQRSLQNQYDAPNPMQAAYWAGRTEALEFVLYQIDPTHSPDNRDRFLLSFTSNEPTF